MDEMNIKSRTIPCSVTVPVKQFILLDECPAAWKELNLYVFRDESSVFYVGQSHHAFSRVWDHIKNGYKARSEVGLFILCNWPKSMNFQIDLLSSRAQEFDEVEHNVSRAEEILIKRFKPCFNISQNSEPCPIPETYFPPSSAIRSPRSLIRMRYQAEQSILNDKRKMWMEAES
jgi:hypothetical protein